MCFLQVRSLGDDWGYIMSLDEVSLIEFWLQKELKRQVCFPSCPLTPSATKGCVTKKVTVSYRPLNIQNCKCNNLHFLIKLSCFEYFETIIWNKLIECHNKIFRYITHVSQRIDHLYILSYSNTFFEKFWIYVLKRLTN